MNAPAIVYLVISLIVAVVFLVFAWRKKDPALFFLCLLAAAPIGFWWPLWLIIFGTLWAIKRLMGYKWNETTVTGQFF